MSTVTFEMRVRVRQEAATIAALAHSEIEREPAELRQVFWEKLKEICEDQLPPEPVPDEEQPMPDCNVPWFRDSLVPYGKYKNQPVRDVPLSYLDWLIRHDYDYFKRQSEQYLLRDDIQQQLREELERDRPEWSDA